ncbi:hypothetical protein GF420_06745 [candidate division GN15 bacterium]|nr:hypothetical protein [candidate division GN15 bacterium]
MMSSQAMVILDQVADGRLTVDQAIERLGALFARIRPGSVVVAPDLPTCFSGATSDVLY